MPRDSYLVQLSGCFSHPVHIILVGLIFYLLLFYYLLFAIYIKHFVTFYINIY